jgi:hypothetical protein
VFTNIHGFLTILTNVGEGVAAHHSNVVTMHWRRGVVYVWRVARRVRPVVVAILVVPILVMFHCHVVGARIGDVIIVVKFLQE